VAQLDRMGVLPLLDAHVPTHGHGVGLSLGRVTVLWLTHLLSEADHRLNHGEPWAEQRLHTLRGSTGQRVHPLDLSDDRLAAVLEGWSDDARWQTCEGALTQPRLRVDDLQPERVRLESPTASGSWRVTEDGLFQFGHSKDYRPDLPQVNGMRSALDPLGLPVATDIVPGQRADDPLYVPAITRVRARVGRRGLLYVGDCKMGALQTRAFLQAGGDTSRCPLAEVQVPPEVWEGYLAAVQTGHQPLTRITRVTATGTRGSIADGYERVEPVTADVAGAAHTWTERRLVVRSRQLARAGETALRARLAYRSQYLVESDMGRLKGRPLSLTPMYLERDDHVTGLIRLLSVGLRVLTLVEFVVRRCLAAERTVLAGLYAGNPTRATARPTTERLLKRVEGLTLTIIREGRRRRYHLTPLSRVHRRMLALLNFPVDIYTRLCPNSHKPP
jgi:transposase